MAPVLRAASPTKTGASSEHTHPFHIAVSLEFVKLFYDKDRDDQACCLIRWDADKFMPRDIDERPAFDQG